MRFRMNADEKFRMKTKFYFSFFFHSFSNHRTKCHYIIPFCYFAIQHFVQSWNKKEGERFSFTIRLLHHQMVSNQSPVLVHNNCLDGHTNIRITAYSAKRSHQNTEMKRNVICINQPIRQKAEGIWQKAHIIMIMNEIMICEFILLNITFSAL